MNAKRIKIAYIIRAHKNPDQIARLFRAIYAPWNTYMLHIDRTADRACHRVAAELAASHANAALLPSRNVRWGGYSLVDTDLRAIRRYLQADDEWTHWINLSGQCFPLASQQAIAARLAEHPGQSFVEHFDALHSAQWPDALERVRRISLELPGTRSRFVVPWLSLDRRFMLRGDRWYGGSCWVTLTREAAAYMVSPATAHLRRFFRHTLIPDESIFQTALLNSPYRDAIVNDDLRYVRWDSESSNPRVLTLDQYDDMVASGKLFARKFDASVDARMLSRIESQVNRNLGRRSEPPRLPLAAATLHHGRRVG